MKAVCLKCGGSKKTPLSKCRICGFDPTLDTKTSAESIRLSKKYWIKDDERTPSDEELLEASTIIKNGGEYGFDEVEINELIKEKEALDKGLSVPERLKLILLVVLLTVPGTIGVVFLIRRLIT